MPEELRNSFGNNPRNVGINKIINQKQITMKQKNFGTILNPVMEHLLLGNLEMDAVNYVVVTDEGLYNVGVDGTVINGPIDLGDGDLGVGTYLVLDMDVCSDEDLEPIYEFFGVEEPDFIDKKYNEWYFKFQEEE